MEEHDRALAERQIEAVVTMTTAADHLRGSVDLLHGMMSQLMAVLARLEARLGHVPAE
jgi:hypothetical protein